MAPSIYELSDVEIVPNVVFFDAMAIRLVIDELADVELVGLIIYKLAHPMIFPIFPLTVVPDFPRTFATFGISCFQNALPDSMSNHFVALDIYIAIVRLKMIINSAIALLFSVDSLALCPVTELAV